MDKHLGKLCINGHDWENSGMSLLDKRGHCCECIKMYAKNWSARKENAKQHEYEIIANHNEIEDYKKIEPKIKLKKEKKVNYIKTRMKNDFRFKLRMCMGSSIRQSIMKNKNGYHWETLVGYTLDELKNHLEKQFKSGMTWDNYGEWHIDHIIPISAFNFNSPDQIDFKRCWALKNLQPLWAKENLIKKDKLKEDFQPCFKF